LKYEKRITKDFPPQKLEFLGTMEVLKNSIQITKAQVDSQILVFGVRMKREFSRKSFKSNEQFYA